MLAIENLGPDSETEPEEAQITEMAATSADAN